MNTYAVQLDLFLENYSLLLGSGVSELLLGEWLKAPKGTFTALRAG
jgi:hypothetical protein